MLCRKQAIYRVAFSANIGATTAGETAQINININDSPLLGTTMLSKTINAGDLNNVAKNTAVQTCCCGNEFISIVNTGETIVNIAADASLFIQRIA
jgi:hypothetical protein